MQRAMQSRCCWPAGQPVCVVVQPALDLVPERGPLEGLLERGRPLAPCPGCAGRTRRCRRSTSETGSASGTPSRSACAPRPDRPGAVQVLAVVDHVPVNLRGRDQVVHPVEAANQSALAAPGWADQRCDLVLGDLHRDAVDGLLACVEDAEVLELEDAFPLRAALPGAVGRAGIADARDIEIRAAGRRPLPS